MADISVEQNSSAGQQNTWIWATVAVLAVVGLMAWLATRPVQTTPVADEGTGTEATTAAAFGSGETVELSVLGGAPDTYLNRQVTVQGASVAAALGPRAFWADIPGANPFLVVLGEGAEGVGAPAPGQSYDLSGTVQAVDEATINQWVTAGTINQGARDEASFATHYLQATQARPAAAWPAGSASRTMLRRGHPG